MIHFSHIVLLYIMAGLFANRKNLRPAESSWLIIGSIYSSRDPIDYRPNTHRFADYKERVIDLLGRVCTVSV